LALENVIKRFLRYFNEWVKLNFLIAEEFQTIIRNLYGKRKKRERERGRKRKREILTFLRENRYKSLKKLQTLKQLLY